MVTRKQLMRAYQIGCRIGWKWDSFGRTPFEMAESVVGTEYAALHLTNADHEALWYEGKRGFDIVRSQLQEV